MKLLFSILAVALIAAAPAVSPSTGVSQSVQNAMRAGKVPGAQIVVVDHGQVVLDRGYGVSSLTTRTPVNTNTEFEIGSITKQFTAAAILQLKERGKLSLSDRLGKYVPEYPQAKNVTIEQLLWQVSGIPNYTDVPNFLEIATSRQGSLPAVLDLIKNKPLDFAPGTKWAYSNTNYFLLGRIVALTSGMTWQQYVRTHIFTPAGMTHSTFMEEESSVPDMATGYYEKDGKVVPSPPFGGWASSAGAIVSTAGDLAKWDAALFGGKLVSAADLALMTSAGHLNNGKPTNYGFGWVIDTYDGQNRIWHNGGTFGFGSINETLPQLGQRIIVLENNVNAAPSGIANEVFGDLHPELAKVEQTAAAHEDPAVTARAKSIWLQFVNGPLDRSQFSPKMNAALTPDVAAAAKAQFASLGPASSWVYRGEKTLQGQKMYAYHVTFATGVALNIYMSIAPDGKISGYFASPN